MHGHLNVKSKSYPLFFGGGGGGMGSWKMQKME